MDVITVFFSILSIIVLVYLGFILTSKKRLPVFIEVFYVFAYFFVLLVVLFPSLLEFIENSSGINNVLQFLVYLSIFVAYFMILLLFKRNEELRAEITKLVREIALMERKKKKE
jgi:hypothetical protein